MEGLVWAALLVSYVATARFANGRLSAALAWAGERSYGLYLMHVPFIYILMFRGWGLDVPGGPMVDATVTGLVLVLPCAVALSALSYSAVEQPFLSLRRRYVVAPPSAPTSTEVGTGVSPAVSSRPNKHRPAIDVHQRAASSTRS